MSVHLTTESACQPTCHLMERCFFKSLSVPTIVRHTALSQAIKPTPGDHLLILHGHFACSRACSPAIRSDVSSNAPQNQVLKGASERISFSTIMRVCIL